TQDDGGQPDDADSQGNDRVGAIDLRGMQLVKEIEHAEHQREKTTAEQEHSRGDEQRPLPDTTSRPDLHRPHLTGERGSHWRDSLDFLRTLVRQPRRRRASAALGPDRVRQYGRTGVAVIAGIALLVCGLAVFRLWSAIHAVSPRAQPQDLIALVQAKSDEPGSLSWKIKHEERINILRLGYGGPGHDG